MKVLFGVFIVFCWFAAFGNAIRCLKGVNTTLSNDVTGVSQTISNFTEVQCPEGSTQCLREETTGTVLTIVKLVGAAMDCGVSLHCDREICSGELIKRSLDSFSRSNTVINSCGAICCTGDLCNSRSNAEIRANAGNTNLQPQTPSTEDTPIQTTNPSTPLTSSAPTSSSTASSTPPPTPTTSSTPPPTPTTSSTPPPTPTTTLPPSTTTSNAPPPPPTTRNPPPPLPTTTLPPSQTTNGAPAESPTTNSLNPLLPVNNNPTPSPSTTSSSTPSSSTSNATSPPPTTTSVVSDTTSKASQGINFNKISILLASVLTVVISLLY